MTSHRDANWPRAKPTLNARRERWHVELWLTAAEARRLARLADTDLRSVDNYVSKFLIDELARVPARRTQTLARGRRSIHSVRLWLTAAEKRKLEVRADAAGTSLGGYVRSIVARRLRA